MLMLKTVLNFIGGSRVAQIALLVLLLVLVVLGVVWATADKIDDVADDARAGGRAEVRAEIAEEGLSNVENANRAAEAVDRDPVVRDAACLRYSRTPENC